ncbi:hypothetical protein M2T28_14225 [Elizabethkingia miricola]|jgi:hypothetical protein|uniref:hypothetical protein n=1 Tax=Elizabethkingia miricola TaxID=172045 RepID=UPI002018D297|nr:hypothetical protein [Elizabethkingia miricola]MCL1653777.1 hypothetical protein [Elizabethkingia miricola]DAN07599.1 MAG TPA: hypothetical protein [Crassvirales sp.]
MIKYISIETSSKNIILTILENEQYVIKRGLNPMIKADWEYIDKSPELIPYREIAWKDKTRPE